MRWGAPHRSPPVLEQRVVLAARELELLDRMGETPGELPVPMVFPHLVQQLQQLGCTSVNVILPCLLTTSATHLSPAADSITPNA
jgi:hypothetical protein